MMGRGGAGESERPEGALFFVRYYKLQFAERRIVS
jgi:hypothetical protein